MKRKPLTIKLLHYSSATRRWHADPRSTYTVLDTEIHGDGNVVVKCKTVDNQKIMYNFHSHTSGLWRIGHKDYDVRWDDIRLEFYKDIQNRLTSGILESLNG